MKRTTYRVSVKAEHYGPSTTRYWWRIVNSTGHIKAMGEGNYDTEAAAYAAGRRFMRVCADSMRGGGGCRAWTPREAQ